MYTVEIRDSADHLLFVGQPLEISFVHRWGTKGECECMFSPSYTNPETGKVHFVPELTNSNIVRPWRRVVVQHAGITVWEGYIENINDKIDTLVLQCIDFLGYAEKKLLPTGGNWVGARADDILDTLWADMQSVSDTGYTLDASGYPSFYTLRVSAGDSLASVLQKMIRRGAEIRVAYPNITVGGILSRNRTLLDGTKLVYSTADPTVSTIEPPKKVILYGHSVVNTLYAKGRTGVHVIRDIYPGDEEIAEYKYFSSTGAELQQEADAYWADKTEYQTYDIVPLPNALPLGSVAVGDAITLDIHTGNPRVDTTQTLIIQEIEVEESSPYITGLRVARGVLQDAERAEVIDRLSALESE